MERYERLRIQYGNGSKCMFCNRPLPVFVTIVRNENGDLFPCGSACAVNHSINPHEAIPDLTKALPLSRGQSVNTASQNSSQAHKESMRVVEYLLLRQMILKEFIGITYVVFEPMLERYESGHLTPGDIRHIEAVMKKVEHSQNLRKLSLSNLKTCYLYDHALSVQLKGQVKSEFLRGLRKFLRTHYYLTYKQKQAVIKGFKSAKELKKKGIVESRFFND